MLSLKEEAEARVDVLSSPRVMNSTRVHSRHHLLNRAVREMSCLVTGTDTGKTNHKMLA